MSGVRSACGGGADIARVRADSRNSTIADVDLGTLSKERVRSVPGRFCFHNRHAFIDLRIGDVESEFTTQHVPEFGVCRKPPSLRVPLRVADGDTQVAKLIVSPFSDATSARRSSRAGKYVRELKRAATSLRTGTFVNAWQ